MQARVPMKFAVRCVTKTATWGAGPLSGLYSAPFTALGANGI
jgi:hypothetical protein